MELQISCSVCTEISQTSDLRETKRRNRTDTEETVRTKRDRNHRSECMFRSYPYVDQYSTKNECVICNRVFEREKLADDL